MAIKIAPKMNADDQEKSPVLEVGDVIDWPSSPDPKFRKLVVTDAVPSKRVRKPSGKAKVAVTLRLSKECMDYFEREFGDDFRMQMQAVIESSRR